MPYPLRRLAGRFLVVLRQAARHLSRETRGGADDPARVPRHDLAIDARLVVEALQIPDGRELDEVLVALAVAREQNEVVVRLPDLTPAHADRLLVAAVAGRDVRLHADDGPDALLLRRLAEGPRPEQAAVVGESQRGHLVFLRPADEVGEAVGAVEEGVLGVAVQVNEGQGRGPGLEVDEDGHPIDVRERPLRKGPGERFSADADGTGQVRQTGSAGAAGLRSGASRGLPGL